MPRVNFRDVGNFGLIVDVPGHELPPETWTAANNVVMRDGYVAPIAGEKQVEGAPTDPPTYLFSSPSPTSPFWLYTDLDDFYAVNAGVHTKITRASGVYTGDMDDRWNGGWLNGVMVVNNGKDLPQVWSPISVGTALIDLPNWDSGWRAKVFRPHRNLYMALNVTKSSVEYPTMVKWSDATDPGTYPTTWDETSPTNLAGEIPLSQTPGHIIDGRNLGGSFMVFKSDAVHRMDRIASNAVFAERAISTGTGIMAQECAQEFKPGRLVMLTRDADVVVTDGQSIEPITDRRVRRALEMFISGNIDRCFLVCDYVRKEAWVCYPRANNDYCIAAWVWHWEDNTWSHRTISQTLDIKAGVYDQSAVVDAWSGQTETWETVNRAWGQRLFTQGSYRLLGAFPVDDEIRELNVGQGVNDAVHFSYIERTGLAIVGQGRDGSPKTDPNLVKMVTEIYPVMTAPGNLASMKINVGSQDHPNGPITWYGAQKFDPRLQEKIDVEIEGRYLAIRFECADRTEWKLFGFGMQIAVVGEYD